MCLLSHPSVCFLVDPCSPIGFALLQFVLFAVLVTAQVLVLVSLFVCLGAVTLVPCSCAIYAVVTRPEHALVGT